MISIWDDLQCYYRRFGTETCCCLNLSRYSDRKWYYEDADVPSTTRRIIEQAYNDAKVIGLHPHLYECRIVCASDLFFPEMTEREALVSYLLDDHKTLITRRRESLSNDVYHQRAVHVYFSVSDKK